MHVDFLSIKGTWVVYCHVDQRLFTQGIGGTIQEGAVVDGTLLPG
jgi:hypothetical protein